MKGTRWVLRREGGSNSSDLSDKYRTKVMKSLDGDVKIPTVIAKDSEIRPNHISKVLAELKAHNLVECINPEAKKGRLYRLTDNGDEIININTESLY